MKVEQQGLTIRSDQNIRRLDIKVDKLPVVSVLERVGQTRGHQADRLDIGRLIEETAIRPRRLASQGILRLGRIKSIEGVEDVGPASTIVRDGGQFVQDMGEGRAAEIRHAEGPKSALGKDLFRIKRDDMSML